MIEKNKIEKSLPKKPKSINWYRLPMIFLIFGILSVSFMFLAYRIRDKQVQYTLLLESTDTILAETAIAHLQIDEYLINNRDSAVNYSINLLDDAVKSSAVILNGGEMNNGLYFKPLKNPDIYRETKRFDFLIREFREIGIKRAGMSRDSLIGSDIPVRFDTVFKEIIETNKSLKSRINEERIFNLKYSTIILWSVIIFWFATLFISFLFILRLVRQRKEWASNLSESEERFHKMAENIDDDLMIMKGTKKVFVNEKLCEILGRSREEVMALKEFEHFVDPEDIEKIKKFKNEVMVGKLSRGELEYFIVRKDGSRRIVNNRYNFVHSEKNEIERYIIVTDVTQKREAESRIERSEERFRYMGESIHDGLLINEDGKTVYINERMCEILGRSREEILKVKKAEEFISMQDRAKMVTLKKDAMSKSLPYAKIECWNEKNDGTKAYVQHCYSTKKTEDGKTYRYIVTTDLTDKKIAEEKNLHLAKIFEDSLSEIYILDTETLKFIEVNRAARENLGYSMEELRDMNPIDLKTGLTRDDIKTITKEVRTGEKDLINFNTTHQRKDGSRYPVEIFLQKILYESEQCFLCMVIDISEKIEAEKKSKNLEEAIKQSWDIIMISDKDGIISYVNDSFERITGYTREEAIGQKPSFLKSGEQDESFYREMWEIISSGETWNGKLINRKKDGTLYNEDATISPIKDSNEKIISYVAVMRDVSREVQMEAQLLQAQKMEAIGRLAGGVAHDFNNLLVGIIGYSELLKDTLSDDMAIQHRYIEEIRKAGERASSLTKQLLAFGRKQLFHPQIIDINSAIHNTQMMLKRIIGEDINVEIAPGENVEPIKADPDHIAQILLNFATNARDAMPDGGTLRIETSNIYLDDFFVKNHEGSKEGHYVLLNVSDTGCGMDKETLAHIFEPFYTTKDIDKGTGLGLSTVYGIVKQNDGYISVYSEVGKGSSFKIYMPVPTGAKKIEIADEFADDIVGGSETILVVEDEEIVKKMTREILEQYGYKVLDASNGKEALLIMKDKNHSVDLLLTDIVMPDMRGDMLAKEVSEGNPSVKIVFMSGYSETVIAKEGGLFGSNGVIQKPFTSRELTSKLRRVLDSG